MSNVKLIQILRRPPGRSPLPPVVVSVKRSAFGVEQVFAVGNRDSFKSMDLEQSDDR
jgi:hypothetical protein